MVQGRRFPYLYAVPLARKEFHRIDRYLKRVPELCFKHNITVEHRAEKDVGVTVIRQHTIKKAGHHTNDPAVTTLSGVAWQGVRAVLQVPAR